MSQKNIKYSQLVYVYKWLKNLSNSLYSSENNITIDPEEVKTFTEYTHQAIFLIKQLLQNINVLTKQLEELNKQVKLYRLQESEIRQSLNSNKQHFEEKYNQQNQKINILEESRSNLLAELASLKRNSSTHYQSDSPKHYILIDKYKTLKDQELASLINNLFQAMAEIKPEFRQQRKQIVNHIKATLSVTVLIKGQEIMQGNNREQRELPQGLLEETREFLHQKLQNFQAQTSQIEKFLQKVIEISKYPRAGEWKEEDFHKASEELREYLYDELNLDSSSLTQDLKNQTTKAIQNALNFLEDAALCEPPAILLLYKEKEPFCIDYHEAALGWHEGGKIVKTVYPAYIVNGEAKVRAVVLTDS